MRRGQRPAAAGTPAVAERRSADRRDLRDAMDHLQDVYRQDWGLRPGRSEVGGGSFGPELQAAKNRVLALRLKHGL